MEKAMPALRVRPWRASVDRSLRVATHPCRHRRLENWKPGDLQWRSQVPKLPAFLLLLAFAFQDHTAADQDARDDAFHDPRRPPFSHRTSTIP
jgi:hypothetical protein